MSEETICDNGTQFTSKDYKEFATQGTDSLWLQAVLTTQKAMVSLQCRSRSSKSWTADVMRMVPVASWLHVSSGQPHWQQDTITRTSVQKEVENKSSSHHQAPKKSEAIRSLLQVRKDSSSNDAYAKER